MDYSQLSDFEINKLVAQEKQYPLKPTQHFGDAGLSIVILEHGYPSHFDPCNNPADAWPIIESNHIALHPIKYKGIWVALSHDHEYSNRDVNPLRAAMVTFLTWKGSFNA